MAGSGDRIHAIWVNDYSYALLRRRVPNREIPIFRGNGRHWLWALDPNPEGLWRGFGRLTFSCVLWPRAVRCVRLEERCRLGHEPENHDGTKKGYGSKFFAMSVAFHGLFSGETHQGPSLASRRASSEQDKLSREICESHADRWISPKEFHVL